MLAHLWAVAHATPSVTGQLLLILWILASVPPPLGSPLLDPTDPGIPDECSVQSGLCWFLCHVFPLSAGPTGVESLREKGLRAQGHGSSTRAETNCRSQRPGCLHSPCPASARPRPGLVGPQQASGREAGPGRRQTSELRPWAPPFCSLGCPSGVPPHPQVFGQRLSNDLLGEE